MKIYLIQGNSGEVYPEDYYEWIEGIYLSKENAKKELKRLKAKAKRDHKKDNFWAEREYKIIELTTKD
jgi:hypothetical protein